MQLHGKTSWRQPIKRRHEEPRARPWGRRGEGRALGRDASLIRVTWVLCETNSTLARFVLKARITRVGSGRSVLMARIESDGESAQHVGKSADLLEKSSRWLLLTPQSIIESSRAFGRSSVLWYSNTRVKYFPDLSPGRAGHGHCFFWRCFWDVRDDVNVCVKSIWDFESLWQLLFKHFAHLLYAIRGFPLKKGICCEWSEGVGGGKTAARHGGFWGRQNVPESQNKLK